MMIDIYANRIAVAIKEANTEITASVEVMQYALILLFNGFTIFFSSLLIGLITGRFYETLVILISFAILRQLSGGFHFESGVYCIITSTALLSSLPHIPLPDNWIMPLTFISLLSFLAFAPSDIDQQTRIPSKYYPVLKLISVLLVCSNFFLLSEIFTKAIFTQAVFIIKLRR
jgi:accessory gene regulator B